MTLGELKELVSGLPDDSLIMIELEDIYNPGEHFRIIADALAETKTGLRRGKLSKFTEIVFFEEGGESDAGGQ